MDGRTLPFVGLAGYQVTVPAYETWHHVLCLSWTHFNRRINLGDDWADYYQDRFAFPVRMETTSPNSAAIVDGIDSNGAQSTSTAGTDSRCRSTCSLSVSTLASACRNRFLRARGLLSVRNTDL